MLKALGKDNKVVLAASRLKVLCNDNKVVPAGKFPCSMIRRWFQLAKCPVQEYKVVVLCKDNKVMPAG